VDWPEPHWRLYVQEQLNTVAELYLSEYIIARL
jgi:hypothetical protein